jgi:hypothetical protein
LPDEDDKADDNAAVVGLAVALAAVRISVWPAAAGGAGVVRHILRDKDAQRGDDDDDESAGGR